MAEAQGQWARAVQLLSAAETQQAVLNLEWDIDLPIPMEITRLRAVLCGQLDEVAFTQAWVAGEKMRLDEAVEYALEAIP